MIGKGWFVCGCARRQEKIAELQKQYDSKSAHFSIVDVSNEKQMKEWCDKIAKEIGIPKMLIGNAGAFVAGSVAMASVADFDKVMNVNVKGVFLLCKYWLPYLKSEKNSNNKCGIFAVSSAAGRNGMGKFSLYCASKWALEGFMASMAKELEGTNVICASYDPGAVNTEMTGSMPETEKWVSSQEEGKAGVDQFLKTMNDSSKNGAQLTTTMINDERQQLAFSALGGAIKNIA